MQTPHKAVIFKPAGKKKKRKIFVSKKLWPDVKVPRSVR